MNHGRIIAQELQTTSRHSIEELPAGCVRALESLQTRTGEQVAGNSACLFLQIPERPDFITMLIFWSLIYAVVDC